MRKKEKNNIKRTLTFIIIFAIGITALAGLRIIRVQIESQTDNLLQEIPTNFEEISNKEAFDVIKTQSGKSLILFTSNWCGACSSMKEKLLSLAKTYPEIQIYVADIETYRNYSTTYNVAITPALVLIEGTNFNTIQEIRPESLENTIEEFSLLGI